MPFSMHLFPSAETLEAQAQQTPEHMRRNELPFVVVAEGYLENGQSDAILDEMMELEPYDFPTCGAVTRESPRPLSDILQPVVTFARMANDFSWMYDLDPDPDAWLQTYHEGGNYHEHMDYTIGQSRKLTAVAILSSEKDYSGGKLMFNFGPHTLEAPKTRGTILVFPAFMLHYVTTIRQGRRQTLNVGFYGPQFR